MNFRCYASCAFGIESVLARELKNYRYENVDTKDGRVYFNADEYGIARANLWLRTADRIYIILKEFEAVNFTQLYDEIRSVDFNGFLPSDAKLPVNGNAVKSTLMSVADIQSITKKAIVDNLCGFYKIKSLPESGSIFNIFINILNNKASLVLNTSGAGLNRRGYRIKNVEAPLRETLAAALVLISRWKDRNFYDPMCGGGTLAIEAAMIASNTAPGLYRHFDAQNFNNKFKASFKTIKEEAQNEIKIPKKKIIASDKDKKSVLSSIENAKSAHVYEYIKIEEKDFKDIDYFDENSTLITNPPYSIRLGNNVENEKLYREMGDKLWNTSLNFYILCANDKFERYFGHKADKKRKMYNGNIRCDYYQYFKKSAH